jgi:hypothetical protein
MAERRRPPQSHPPDLNLPLGLLVVVIGASGRYWG